ncbi:hypothetical protein AMATHDRAFT_19 [Amanita thiersii Skay4041]|uniref:Uncharacterized protein n=1 Tax=Amanita thiersii Skay4041 TaxID=703135 RepID=A0A2A9NTY2_9AGAR|nr:hypothetical protein AMATHDRAFT_19 [Amanita thiersii Skay4041]
MPGVEFINTHESEDLKPPITDDCYSSGSTLPQPIFARFIRPRSRSASVDSKPRDVGNDTLDITDSLTATASWDESYPGTVASSTAIDYGSYDETLLNDHKYPPGTYTAAQPLILHRSHTPIPATVLFARKAAPLYLSQLDQYLASLPAPPFKHSDEHGMTMFPPMEKLKGLGLSLDDLETNSKVAPVWRNRKTILGATVNIMLGFLGSSALASFYSLQGLFNTVQIFALILSTIVPVGGRNLKDNWRKLLLGTIPNVLALNFASTAAQSLFFLMVFMTITFGLLYMFYRSVCECDRYNFTEGLLPRETKGRQWGIIIVTFILTIIYLPLSTMAVHVLVWSQDLWAIPNPYTNATSVPPSISPLGAPNVYRDPLDFCWTTTMKRNQVNYAPFIVVVSIVAIASVRLQHSDLTIWFPIALRRVIRKSVPKVDKFTEIGRPRNSIDLDSEYQRLLSRDRSPFAFLYNGFRRDWGTFESTYLFAKLSTLAIVAVLDSDNCLFRNVSRSVLPIVRQVLLLLASIVFFAVQSIHAPFLDPVNNASEWTSRLNYVTTSITALLIAINVPGKQIIDTYVLYTIYIITYGLSFYFTVINWSITQRLVKRITRRIDFSLDIFSPRLDISKSSIHAKRRIWQESITTLILTNSACKIPKEQRMMFSEPRDSEFPPYLLDFMGTPGERHIENLKILREIGSFAYSRAVALVSGPEHHRYQHLEDTILKNFIGPDCYWKKGRENYCAKFFGNAWWIPFPPTLILRYDDGGLAVLHEIHILEEYVKQNMRRDIQKKRQIRLALRALDGLRVRWPYEHTTPIGSRPLWSLWCCRRNHYRAGTVRKFQTCILRIKSHGYLPWHAVELGSGFDVVLEYSRDVQVSGDVIGLNDDFDLTKPLASFLELNHEAIGLKVQYLEDLINRYRRHERKECLWKRNVLSYRFLSFVYDQPREPTGLAASTILHERDIRVRQLLAGSDPMFDVIYARFSHVTSTEARAWWYIFWDDLWRRNRDTISPLQKHESDFNPHYPTSIAYTPLSRPVLESFLVQRGLMSKPPRRTDWMYSGFLNKIYLRLNEIVFKASHKAIFFHVGDGESELDMDGVDLETQGQPSSFGTGGGTDHDASAIRPRPVYRWEGLLDDPVRHGKQRRRRRWFAKLGAWFGITPLWREGVPSNGLSLDVRMENGHYIPMYQDFLLASNNR